MCHALRGDVVHDCCCRCILPIVSLALTLKATISLLIEECSPFVFILADFCLVSGPKHDMWKAFQTYKYDAHRNRATRCGRSLFVQVLEGNHALPSRTMFASLAEGAR